MGENRTGQEFDDKGSILPNEITTGLLQVEYYPCKVTYLRSTKYQITSKSSQRKVFIYHLTTSLESERSFGILKRYVERKTPKSLSVVHHLVVSSL